jgi:hypothetical protein
MPPVRRWARSTLPPLLGRVGLATGLAAAPATLLAAETGARSPKASLRRSTILTVMTGRGNAAMPDSGLGLWSASAADSPASDTGLPSSQELDIAT